MPSSSANNRSPKVLISALLLLVIAGFLAFYMSRYSRLSDAARYRATPIPDRIVLSWTHDPATSRSVNWRTATSVREATAEIALAGPGPGFAESARSVPATTERLSTDLGAASYHSARFDDLEPDTLYAYRVGSEDGWSEWNQFRTSSDASEPLTFLYMGDAQKDIYSQWSRVVRTSIRETPDAQFIIYAGDLVNTGWSDAGWGEWFSAAGWINRSVPILSAPGNHEYFGGEGFTPHWRAQFTLPENGPAGLEEECYYYDVQGVRLIALNSYEQLETQAEWLDQLLANNPNRWTIAYFHHPIFGGAHDRDNKEVRETWQPIFDKYAVDLVLQGHDHIYARSGVARMADTPETEGGTVYVVSVSGPKQYELEDRDWMVRSGQQLQLYQVIRIDGDTLAFEAHTADGELYDSFDLRIHDGTPNELIEHNPAREMDPLLSD